jgi:hypothetical protein
MEQAAVAVLDKDEQLVWGVLARLEKLALSKYTREVPELAIPEKKEVVRALTEGVPDDSPLDSSLLGQPIRDLLEAAGKPGQADTLIVQGMLLERLGQIIYKMLGSQQTVSVATRTLAGKGWTACTAVIKLASERVRALVGEGEPLFQTFSDVSDSVLRKLDSLGTGVDELFGKRFGLTFTEVLGDFTAELLPACVELGMNRRKLICLLAGVFMGQ